jgi:hypothetical protein
VGGSRLSFELADCIGNTFQFTMVTMAGHARERLTSLRNGLLRLHKSLMDSERVAYERDVQRIRSAGEYLNLVLNDPWFSWLRDLSRLVVTIDVMLDRKESPVTGEEVEKLIVQARELVAPSENGSGFAGRYYEAMQRDAGAVLAHRDMMRVFEEVGKR